MPYFGIYFLGESTLHASSSKRCVVVVDEVVCSVGPFVVGMGMEMIGEHILGTDEWARGKVVASMASLVAGMAWERLVACCGCTP